jgi:hypothetical protein
MTTGDLNARTKVSVVNTSTILFCTDGRKSLGIKMSVIKSNRGMLSAGTGQGGVKIVSPHDENRDACKSCSFGVNIVDVVSPENLGD